MNYVAGNVAREIGKLHDWREKSWARRYRSIVVSQEEEAQVGRLAYILGNGVKEGLIARPQNWPGVHCAQALLDGTALEGTWFDRTAEYEAHRKGKEKTPADFAQAERVVFTPIPCWAAQGLALYGQRIATLVDSIVANACRERDGQGVLGRRAILAQHPCEKPLDCDRSPAPAVHAATKAIRLMLRAQYRQFAAAFRQAAHLLRRGDRLARFPPGAFPPPMPCVVSTA